MVFIKNSLPIKQGGVISHGDTSIRFTKDSNSFETYNTITITSKHEFMNCFGYCPQVPMTTINDCDIFPVPITVNFYKQGDAQEFFFYYYDLQTNKLTFCGVNSVSDVAIDVEKDIFFAYETEVFYIPYNNSKVIYHVTLEPEEMSLSWTAVSTCFNTHDGSSSGHTFRESQVVPIGANSTIFIFFGGFCDNSSYNSYARTYLWDNSSKQLSFQRLSDSIKTYNDTGYFYPISKYNVVGLNCMYSGTGIYTGYNISFVVNSENLLELNPFDFYTNSRKTIMDYAGKYHNGGYFWKGKPKLVSYYKTESEINTCYTLDGFTYKETRDVNYINPAVMFGLSDTDFLSIPKANSNNLTTIELSTLENSTIKKKTVYTTTEKSFLFKIPGVPVIYCDPDLNTTPSLSFYICSDLSRYPLLLPPGSVINGETITSEITPYPISGQNLNIITRGAPLNKTIYGIQNNRGINI